MKNIKICEHCGREITSNYGKGRFCDKFCKAAFVAVNRKKGNVSKKICPNCKREIGATAFNRHYKACVNEYKIRCSDQPKDDSEKAQAVKNRAKPKKQSFKCEFCGKVWETTKSNYTIHLKYRCEKNPNRKIVFHGPTEEGKKRLSEIAKRRGLGGFVPDSRGGKEKRGYYKGLYCMSSWELAFVVYNLDKGEIVEQCKEHFDYEMNGEKHSYTPDFKIGDIYYEIKGWHRPDTDFKVNAFPKDKTLVLLDGRSQNEIYIKYAKEKYGTKFWEVLYEK